MKNIKLIATIMVALTLIFTVGCEKKENVEETKTLYISAIPDQKQEDLNISMSELTKILSAELGFNVEYKEVTDYTAVVTGFERNEIQLAWFGGLTGVQAREKVAESNAVVQRVEDEEFKSVFIANADANINSLKDYSGKSFTFGSETSTSGHLMPRYFLEQQGIVPEEAFSSEVGYSGSHDKTIELVQNGTYDGGALNISVWERYVKEGLVDTDKVKVVEISEPYYDYNFTVQSKEYIDVTYGEGTYDKLVNVLLNLDVKNNSNLNLFFNTEGFIETNNENYDEIKQIATDLGMLNE